MNTINEAGCCCCCGGMGMCLLNEDDRGRAVAPAVIEHIGQVPYSVYWQWEGPSLSVPDGTVSIAVKIREDSFPRRLTGLRRDDGTIEIVAG